jgi:hypothetical protein
MSDNKPLIFTAHNGIKIIITKHSDPRNVAMVKDLRLEGEEEVMPAPNALYSSRQDTTGPGAKGDAGAGAGVEKPAGY